jgi:tellurite resistance protein TerC
MQVSGLVWTLTLIAIAGLVAFDFYFHVRRTHIPSLREAAIWSSVYVGVAVIFGLGC